MVHVRTVSLAARRPDAVAFSIVIDHVHFGNDLEVEAWERQLCDQSEIDYKPLGDCPYVLSGDASSMSGALRSRVERLDLEAIVLDDGPTLELVCAEVLPLL